MPDPNCKHCSEPCSCGIDHTRADHDAEETSRVRDILYETARGTLDGQTRVFVLVSRGHAESGGSNAGKYELLGWLRRYIEARESGQLHERIDDGNATH